MMQKADVRTAGPAFGPGDFALWKLGFRPFYLMAAIFAALSIVLWICQYTGHLPGAYLAAPAWHGHEMLFGFTLAVVAGFLLTAVPNWTGKPTPTGGALAALAALWLAGRVLVLSPFPVAAAIVDTAFPVAIAVAIARAAAAKRETGATTSSSRCSLHSDLPTSHSICRSSDCSRGRRARACRPGSTSSCSSWP